VSIYIIGYLTLYILQLHTVKPFCFLLHYEVSCSPKTFSLVPKKEEEVAEGWRSLHNEELHNLYNSPNIMRVINSRRMRWACHVVHIRKINAYKILVGKPEGKGPCRRPRRRWEDNIRMDLREIG